MIFQNAKRSCKENYVDVDPANSACLAALGDIQKVEELNYLVNSEAQYFYVQLCWLRSCNPLKLQCIKDLNKKDILKPNCDVSSSDSNRRSLEDGAFLLQPSIVPNPWCTVISPLRLCEYIICMQCLRIDVELILLLEQTFRLTHNKIWANDDSVQDALYVRKVQIRFCIILQKQNYKELSYVDQQLFNESLRYFQWQSGNCTAVGEMQQQFIIQPQCLQCCFCS